MKKAFLVVVLLILYVIPAGHAAEIFDRDTISQCVVHLRQPKVAQISINGITAELWYKLPDQKPQPKVDHEIGTGFFVSKGNDLYLVTASHVAKVMGPDAQVVLKGTNHTPVVHSLSTLHGSATNILWTIHPEADVAVLSLSPPPTVISRDLEKHFLPSRILLAEKRAPSRRRPLIVFGFPLGLGFQGFFSPLTKQTYAASDLLNLKRFDNGTVASFFILEDPSIGGYSGGPVVDIAMFKFGGIQTVESDSKIVGLIHGTIPDRTGGKLAAVVPSCFIVETLNQASSRKQKK